MLFHMEPETLAQLQQLAENASAGGWESQLPTVIIQGVLFLVVLLGAARKVLGDIGQLVNRLMDVDSDQRKLDREHQATMLDRIVSAFEEQVAADRRLSDLRVDTLAAQIDLLKQEIRESTTGTTAKLEELRLAIDKLSLLLSGSFSAVSNAP